MIVLKLGGSILEQIDPAFFDQCRKLWQEGIPFIVVHGGGPFVSGWMKQLGKEPVFVDGRRVTDEDTLEIVQMVLSGQVNKNLVAELGKRGVPALGISGADLKMLQVVPKDAGLGLVGEVTEVNKKAFLQIIEAGWVPVLAPLGIDQSGQIFNVNADEAAGAVAQEMGAGQLVIVSDVDGIFIQEGDHKRLLTCATPEMVERYIEEGQITGGMIPKVRSAMKCLENDVREVWIVNGEKARCMDGENYFGQGTCLLQEEVSKNVSVSHI
ncbi:acetylglutamate kinase [Thermoactinomyces mirandus]|uniref:Acetylglutamate kinase n=1 Tax=Thermoactinomyces mirandus TaxID=2756294 RepID=A0A7W2ARZ2_9BACL|nr:acetylglutamate kinase [Thermoactinomyces mirandus]MBA4603499.1 acetylglutamate kinase [Thermoactinomyces mirandus]